MAILIFVLGAILLAAGGGGVFASLDLLPTELGILYAGTGAVLIGAGSIVLAIGALIRRVEQLSLALEPARPAPQVEPEPLRLVDVEPAADAAPSVAPALGQDVVETEVEEDEPLNENRVGHLPTLSEVEHAIAEPEAAPTLVGHYSAGGANYMIFSDGTIEAETEQGAYRFASMGEFKAYIAGRKP